MMFVFVDKLTVPTHSHEQTDSLNSNRYMDSRSAANYPLIATIKTNWTLTFTVPSLPPKNLWVGLKPRWLDHFIPKLTVGIYYV